MDIDKKEEQRSKLSNIVRGINELTVVLFELGASPEFIIENLLHCDAEYTEDYIREMSVRIERINLVVNQLNTYDVDFSHVGNLYYFSRKGYFVATTVTALLGKNDDYDGEDIVADLSEVIPEILTHELHDAAKRCDWEAVKRVNETITYVFTLLDKQKENSNET